MKACRIAPQRQLEKQLPQLRRFIQFFPVFAQLVQLLFLYGKYFLAVQSEFLPGARCAKSLTLIPGPKAARAAARNQFRLFHVRRRPVDILINVVIRHKDPICHTGRADRAGFVGNAGRAVRLTGRAASESPREDRRQSDYSGGRKSRKQRQSLPAARQWQVFSSISSWQPHFSGDASAIPCVIFSGNMPVFCQVIDFPIIVSHPAVPHQIFVARMTTPHALIYSPIDILGL